MEKNKRQIPKTKEICANKYYNDILYGYLQTVSQWDGEIGHLRYIKKKDIKFQEIANKLEISRQTVSTRFKKLIELGLILKLNDNYVLVNLDINEIALIPKDTLELMVDTLKEHTISIYVYLLSRYIANNNQGFTCLMKHLKGQIGLNVDDNTNNRKIVNILKVLSLLGLVEFHTYTVGNKKSYFVDRVNINVKKS